MATVTHTLSALHHHLLLPSKLYSSTNAHHFPKISHHVPTSFPRHYKTNLKFTTKISFAFVDSDSKGESSGEESVDSDPRMLLRQLSDCFDLPPDYFGQLPRDLRLDLNDAAFDLSNGAVKAECGDELGETLLNISRAWELGDTSTSANLVKKLPLLVDSLTSNNKSALGKRLLSASRKFQSMGQYGQGELQTIAKVMGRTGKLLSASPVTEVADSEPKQEARMFKFGELQVELTREKAYIGAFIGFGFGILSWQLGQGVQSIPESSLEYANDNALLLAKSLRGALLGACYSSAIISAFSTVGLVLLSRQLKSK